MDDGGAASVRAMIHWQYRTICRGPNSILHNLYDLLGPRTHDYISFYGLRAHGRLCESGPVATTQVNFLSSLCISLHLFILEGFFFYFLYAKINSSPRIL